MKCSYLLKKILLLLVLSFFILPINAEEIKIAEKNTEYNVYSGMFDWSDSGKKSTLVGFQHQNQSLNRDTFIGNLSPVSGVMITADSATYV
jgi:lipid A 3-O-deacylase